MTEINNTLTVLNQLLGEICYQVYGDEMSPDATGTLRISDGRIEGYGIQWCCCASKTTIMVCMTGGILSTKRIIHGVCIHASKNS